MIITENTEKCELLGNANLKIKQCLAKAVFMCDYTGVLPLNSTNVFLLVVWHC